MSQRRSNLLDLLFSAPAYQAAKQPYQDPGTADIEPFPFLALVGQKEMKLALLLSLVNPAIGGVLLVGARGTAKSTAVRSLIDLLPSMTISLCTNNLGCTEAKIEAGGMDAVCLECATKFGYGEALTRQEKVRIVELPLNARLEDVVGGIDERTVIEKNQVRLSRGLLARADQNVLYIDEVNLLDKAIADAILDASAQGYYTVWRGPQKLSYRSRFVLIGSMNPEEGALRPQIMDRFGLRVVLSGLTDSDERLEVYRRARQYRDNPAAFVAGYAQQTLALAEEIQRARQQLPDVVLSEAALALGLKLVEVLKIASNRAEFTLFEAARAYAAAAERSTATEVDVAAVARSALRLRQSVGLEQFAQLQESDEAVLDKLLRDIPQIEDENG
ncbi:MAG: ATP-binding protein [Anaerolineales bacterium]|nr:ATP-binding protein [Anaerolineales bacterium]MCB0016741.1 ATP-binding protein [Anaerolineales bacterium]MCB0031902.1 ATP-binding protein [Anaerolineales bacterium]